MAVNPGEFNRLASASYSLLPDGEKERLGSLVDQYQSKKEIARRGATIFKRIQSLVRNYVSYSHGCISSLRLRSWKVWDTRDLPLHFMRRKQNLWVQR